MGKIVMTLHLPEPKVRKQSAKAVQYHKDKSKYCRKAKHKGPWAETHGPFLFLQKLNRDAAFARKGNLALQPL
nr:MAG TPA: hypothetical protein [Caudoviricetes sp.]